MTRGDVVSARLPQQSMPQQSVGGWQQRQQQGHEQSGPRPAIVLQIDAAVSDTVVVIPLTSNTAAARKPYSILLHPSGTNGLRLPSRALVHQMRAVDKDRIESTLGVLSATELEEIENAVRALLGL